MADERVLCLKRIAVTAPWKNIVAAADRKAVVAGSDDFLILVDDACAHLCVGVLASHCRKHCDAHEVLVPSDVVSSLAHLKLLPLRISLTV